MDGFSDGADCLSLELHMPAVFLSGAPTLRVMGSVHAAAIPTVRWSPHEKGRESAKWMDLAEAMGTAMYTYMLWMLWILMF